MRFSRGLETRTLTVSLLLIASSAEAGVCGDWQLIPSPDPGLNDTWLNGVAAAGPDDAWTVGAYSDGVESATLTERLLPGLIGDVNGDGVVGFGDLLDLLASWGPCNGVCPADFDGDGLVGFEDLLIVLANWSS